MRRPHLKTALVGFVGFGLGCIDAEPDTQSRFLFDAGRPNTDAAILPDGGAPASDGGTSRLDGGQLNGDAYTIPDQGTTPSPLAANEFRIQASNPQQTMDGIGANANGYPFSGGTDERGQWNAAAVQQQFRTLKLGYIRFVPWTIWWEPSNDNSDPSTTDWSNMMNNPAGPDIRVAEQLELPGAQWLSGLGVPMFFGWWRANDWLKADVAAGNYAEAAESSVSYYQFFQHGGLLDGPQGTAVPLEIFEVQNEPDLDEFLPFPTPESLRDGALAALDRLDALGLTNLMVHGPNVSTVRMNAENQPYSIVDWVEAWVSNPRLRDRTAAISFHTWWSDDPQAYFAVRDIARREGKPIWATETGLCAVDEPLCANLGLAPLNVDDWGLAIDHVEAIYRAAVWSEATRVYVWSGAGANGAIGPNGEQKTPYFALYHLANYIPPRSVRVPVQAGTMAQSEDLRGLAFIRPDGDRTLVILNRSDRARQLSVRGDNGRRLSVKEGTLSTESDRLQSRTPNLDQVNLPPRSILSLVLNRP